MAGVPEGTDQTRAQLASVRARHTAHTRRAHLRGPPLRAAGAEVGDGTREAQHRGVHHLGLAERRLAAGGRWGAGAGSGSDGAGQSQSLHPKWQTQHQAMAAHHSAMLLCTLRMMSSSAGGRSAGSELTSGIASGRCHAGAPASVPLPRTRQRQQAAGAVKVGGDDGARLVLVLVLRASTNRRDGWAAATMRCRRHHPTPSSRRRRQPATPTDFKNAPAAGTG